MKKIISIFIVLFLICITLTGCQKGWFADEYKFLHEKMSKFPIEYEGYYFENVYGTDEYVPPEERENEYVFRDNPLVIEGNKIIYNGKEILIDINFMEQRSQIFNYINHIWDEEGKTNTKGTFISGIEVYDDKIFIGTCGLHDRFDASVKGLTPFVLYYYDIDNDKVLYCGFYAGELDEKGYYEGFLHTKPKALTIRKK